ncbi:thiol:disulfide interchange protein DsbD [Silvimonas terrae]|uniref:Thiol:disulfide interchange protein DsbD n=1 Tax=Silvimonas terrae TaxID=300266 RepID=A0A840RGE0_9NEIS|nr:thiol:disulfide interchange protein DsbD [Silvimonas terrae]
MSHPVLALDEHDLLPPEQAFKASITAPTAEAAALNLTVAPGYYLYKERIKISATPAQTVTLTLPAGKIKNDPNFGRVEIYPHDVTVPLHASQPWQPGTVLNVSYQGCAAAGVCYPPRTVQLALNTPTATATGPDEGSALIRSNLAVTLGLFFLAGVGLSLTACMYPLLPLVSGIVIGQARSRRKAFGLTLVYVQGLALTYTVIGIAAASTGTLLTVQVQTPITTTLFAAFFVVMALSMFGLFNLQLPSALQSRVTETANRLPGGQLLPVFIMGALSALLVGACMAPPLFGALAYMAKTGDRVLGGSALYALGLGTGAPLLLIGAFGATVLPRLPGKVMLNVKRAFGVVLLGTAVWISHPLWLKSSSHDFTPVSTTAALDEAIAHAAGKPVLLDFYADWCVSCVEFERNVLPDAGVKAALAGFVLLRADVTANTADDAALLKRFGLYGPPAILFYDRQGRLQSTRLIGPATPAQFVRLLGNAAR